MATLKVPAGRSELIVFDDGMPGFGLRIRAGGKRTWIVQYRVGPRTRRLTLGSLDKIDPDEARKLAKATLARAQLGRDPQAEKVEARAGGADAVGRGRAIPAARVRAPEGTELRGS